MKKKLNWGPHCLAPTADALALVEAGVPLVKLVGEALGLAPQYLALNPALIIIGRVYTAWTFDHYNGWDVKAAAADFVQAQLPTYKANGKIHFYEGFNEESFGDPNNPKDDALNRMARYAQFEAERARLLHDLGYGAVVGNFSTGYPELKPDDLRMWTAFLPAIEAAQANGGLLAAHEYAAPWLWWWTGGYQTANCEERTLWQYPAVDGFDMGWLTLRSLMLIKYVLEPNGLTLPVVITEAGFDEAGGGCDDLPTGNWRDLTAWWDKQSGATDPIDYWRGPERDAEHYAAEQLLWYAGVLSQHPQILGVLFYTFGNTGSKETAPYELAGTRIAERLRAHALAAPLVSDKDSNPMTDPTSTPATPTSPTTPATTPTPASPPTLSTPLIQNGSFEGGWTSKGNIQTPNGGVIVHVYTEAEKLFYTTRIAQGKAEPVQPSAGGGVHVEHKGRFLDGTANLPEDELLGGARALVLDGDLCLKISPDGSNNPWAALIGFPIAGVPGALVAFDWPLLGETGDKPTAANGKLEDTHFMARVWIEDADGKVLAVDERSYAEMISNNDDQVAGGKPNPRHWNKFNVQTNLPKSGGAHLLCYVQTMWPGSVDFFTDKVEGRYVNVAAPVVVPVVPPPITVTVNQLPAEVQAVMTAIGDDLGALDSELDTLAAKAAALRLDLSKAQTLLAALAAKGV